MRVCVNRTFYSILFFLEIGKWQLFPMDTGTDTRLLLMLYVESLFIHTMQININVCLLNMLCGKTNAGEDLLFAVQNSLMPPLIGIVAVWLLLGSGSPFDGDAVCVCERHFHALGLLLYFRCWSCWRSLLVNETHKNDIIAVRTAEAVTAWK